VGAVDVPGQMGRHGKTAITLGALQSLLLGHGAGPGYGSLTNQTIPPTRKDAKRCCSSCLGGQTTDPKPRASPFSGRCSEVLWYGRSDQTGTGAKAGQCRTD
jgi:hypothetical protein